MAAASLPAPSRPRRLPPHAPALRGVGRAAADSYFGAGRVDVTAETRAAPGTGAGGGGRVSGHLAAAAEGVGEGRGPPPPWRRAPRREVGSSPRSGPSPSASACACAASPFLLLLSVAALGEEPGSGGRLGYQACPRWQVRPRPPLGRGRSLWSPGSRHSFLISDKGKRIPTKRIAPQASP